MHFSLIYFRQQCCSINFPSVKVKEGPLRKRTTPCQSNCYECLANHVEEWEDGKDILSATANERLLNYGWRDGTTSATSASR